MAITLDGSNGISTPDLESTGPITGTTGTFSGNVTANGLSTELRPLVLGTSQASTSGTAIDFTGVPSWVKRVTVIFSGVSLNGSSSILVQLGDSGGIETTGYSSAASSAATTLTSTAGYIVRMAASTVTISGSMVLTSISGNAWVSSQAFGNPVDGATHVGGGNKTLSDTLTQIRITTVNGTDTFDAGTINIMWE